MKILFLFSLLLGCSHHNQDLADRLNLPASHEELISTYDDPARDKWQNPKWVLQEIGDIKGKKVIDIGAGSGYFAKKFHEKGAHVWAGDVDEKFLKHLRQYEAPRFKVKKIGFNDPKMEPGFFDVAFTSNTYHQIDDRVDYLKKVRKGLSKGGKLVIVDFKPSAYSEEMSGWRNSVLLPMHKVFNEVLKAGFDKIEVDRETLSRQYIVIGTK